MVRRHLGFSVDEWEDLPWHHQQVYLEELSVEFGGVDPEELEQAPQGDGWDMLQQQFGVKVRYV